MHRQLWNDEQGTTTIEYALMLMVMVVGAITAWRITGQTVGDSATNSTALAANAN